MELRDPCLLDLVYKNEQSVDFARVLYTRIAEECVNDIFQLDEEAQSVPCNERAWAYISHVVQTALDGVGSLSAVVAVQYALNREESLRDTVSGQLSERKAFFLEDWIPFLAHNTIEFTNRFRGDNATEVMQDYANIMLDAWVHQRIRERPLTPPPSDEMEVE